MTTTTTKKQKVYKIAAELNLSSQVILDFLEKRGYPVKSHMSAVDPEMVDAIMVHYKKDKDTAERHQKKVAELRKTQKRREQERRPDDKELHEEEKQEEKAEEKTPAKEKVAARKPPADGEAVTDETATEETAAVDEPKPKKTPGRAKSKKGEPEGEAVADVPEAEAEATEEQQVDEEVTVDKKAKDTESAADAKLKPAGRRPLPGLKIKGKVDLGDFVTAGKESREEEETGDGKPKKKRKKRKKKVREESRTATVKQVEPGETEEPAAKKKKKKKKIRARNVDEGEVQEAIRKTLAAMDDSGPSLRAISRKKRKRERLEEEQRKLEEREREKTTLQVMEYITVGELANLMDVPSNEMIQKCIELGMMVSINQRLEEDVITLLADEFGFQVTFQEEFAEDDIEELKDDPERSVSRAPIVTIMGHVDHGKTTLLDFIRKANVVAGESGGITQHIGAYEVMLDTGKTITFLDTPGHEAFTAMRARGAQLTDIVVLVVAADDYVMPQTIEAINHAQAAGVPIIVAINKIDKPNANAERVRQQLSERNVLVEEWGGKYQSVEISAKQGLNIEQLLEKILLEAELLDLKADPEKHARGVIIEAELDRGKGIVATVLVQSGTLHIGDAFIAGLFSGRVRAMYDERDNRLEDAPPSKPVQVTGFDGMPKVGDRFAVLETEGHARDIATKRQQLKREQDLRQIRHITLDDISRDIQAGEVKELSIIVKGDVDGSVEALSESLQKLSNEEVKVNVIHKGVGAINDADVLLAAASQAIIVGFHVRPLTSTRKLAETEKVEIRLYSVIYDAINEVKSALEGLLSPEIKEEITGVAEIRETFKIPKAGTIAGCYIQEGKITRNSRVRLIRDGIVIYEGGLASLKRFKDDVREVEGGYECGIGIEGYNDLKVGDTIEAFKLTEQKRTLQ
jgi:translation initiation factor IF-2